MSHHLAYKKKNKSGSPHPYTHTILALSKYKEQRFCLYFGESPKWVWKQQFDLRGGYSGGNQECAWRKCHFASVLFYFQFFSCHESRCLYQVHSMCLFPHSDKNKLGWLDKNTHDSGGRKEGKAQGLVRQRGTQQEQIEGWEIAGLTGYQDISMG